MTITVKKSDREGPIPTEWRETIRDLVSALVTGGYKTGKLPPSVVPLDEDVIKQISNYIEVYGCTLINLPEESWEFSVYIRQSSYWQVLVDLFSIEEGRSDMVLSIRVKEEPKSYSFEVYLVYVP